MQYLSAASAVAAAALRPPFESASVSTSTSAAAALSAPHDFEDEPAESSSSSCSSSSPCSLSSSYSPTSSHSSLMFDDCSSPGAPTSRFNDEDMDSPSPVPASPSPARSLARASAVSPSLTRPRRSGAQAQVSSAARASTSTNRCDVEGHDDDEDSFFPQCAAALTSSSSSSSSDSSSSPSSRSTSPTPPASVQQHHHHHHGAAGLSSPPVNQPILHPEELLPPVTPPPNSFASAQAAMAAQNSSHSQNLIGHSIDNSTKGYPSRLEFISILGLGAYGVVYLARDVLARPSAFPSSRAHPGLGNQPLYAVKCLNKVGLDERQRSFQRREIALHSLASAHGNVVTLHNWIEEETCIYVVLQFCEEGDLFGMITERQRYLGDDELIRRVFLQIVDAVEFCHQNGIYHRDLKPENILCLDDGEKVVLADFGLATHEKTSGDFGCGSTFYMSPECQGGLFQRLNSYSTPHNDIWSLGVILVNLTCGRNPWKQACPSDETFCAYLGNPDFLRSILPVSEHTNRILKRIFALNPKVRITLKELRREILSVKTFVMTEDELRHATRATKEAARAFAQGIVDESPEEEAELFEESEDSQMDSVQQGDDLLPHSPPASPGAWLDESMPATPTQPFRPAPPITPPATPRRSHRPADITTVPHRSSLKASFSRSSTGSEGSADTLTSDEEATPNPRRRRRDIFLTPPSDCRSVFSSNGPTLEDPFPPSPVTPTPHRRARTNRSGSPRSAASRLAKVTGTGQRRQRKSSFDSSSSSSGASASQPPTPTGPPVYSYSGTSSMPYIAAGQQQCDQEMAYATSGGAVGSKYIPDIANTYTAYYPVVSADWAEAAADQASHYSVTLPPPVFLPACTETEDGTPFEFPMPPTGYYHRAPARAGETPRVEVFESSF